MADQLSLRLEADQLPALPDLRPMLPRPLPGPFDSDDHLFEPWWGGERVLAMIGPGDLPGTGSVRILGAEGADLTAALPELAGLAVRVAARSAILDGLERRTAVGGGAYGIAFVFKHARDELADIGFIVDHENFKRH